MGRHPRSVAVVVAMVPLVLLQFVVTCEAWSDFYFSRGSLLGELDLRLLGADGIAEDLHNAAVAISPVVMNPLGGVLRQSWRSNDRGWQGHVSRIYGAVLRPFPVGRPRILVFAFLNSAVWLLGVSIVALVWKLIRRRFWPRRPLPAEPSNP